MMVSESVVLTSYKVGCHYKNLVGTTGSLYVVYLFIKSENVNIPHSLFLHYGSGAHDWTVLAQAI